MSEWMTDDEDYRQEGSGDGVDIENEIEIEFNKFIELSWVSAVIISGTMRHLKSGGSSRRSLRPNSTWGNIELTTPL